MKYVTRPAPAPPGGFQQSNSTSSTQMAKPKPPRPPPPRAISSNPPSQTDSKSSKLFSNLFGKKPKNATATTHMEVKLPPPRLPPPAALANRHATIPQAPAPVHKSDVQLINFEESPPTSPSPVGFIKKSNTGGSDSVSIDSFCSTNSSPNNFNSGTQSQAESGFEDDFNSVSDFKFCTSRAVSRSTTFSNDPFDLLDEFTSSNTAASAMPAPTVKNTVNIRNLKPTIQPKPVSIGSTNFYASTPSPLSFADDSSKSGKPAVVSMPTIIKPASSSSLSSLRKPSPIHVPSPSPSMMNELKKPSFGPMSNYKELDATSDESFEDEPPSPPMPTIPAPVLVLNNDEDDEESESYAIALFDFDSDVTEDLSFKANEKIYLVKQMNDEWMYGRNRKGCEGIFPVSYVDIRVPLTSECDSGTASRSESVSPASNRVRVLYTFNAEADGDLTILENDFVNVMYEINGEWLYGSNSSGEYGQFPANFLEFVPQNLPLMPQH